MSVVKGSKQINMVVVPHRPVQVFLVRLSVLVCMLLVGTGFYFLGYSNGVFVNGDARAERDQLVIELETANNQVASLRQEVVNNEQASAVDRRALSNVQDTILSLQEKNAQLEEDVLFYKQIMSPENNETGLVIGQLDLLVTEAEDRIRYRIEFKQLANNENIITGYTNVNILGMQDGQEISIPLRSLSVNEDRLDIRLQFRYFQNIEGELVLPDNFEPDKVQILAVSEGRNGKTIQKSFGWLVEM
ncbi:hypothetical protein OAP18_02710 [Gammaproteobacteria bacterium]|nr:hypothetical protein [Gammaproteobacteria bacterium]